MLEKEKASEKTLAADLRKWASSHNLSRIVRFHNDLRWCMRDALAKSDQLNPMQTTLWEARWQDYDSLLRANTFLMLYSHTEEWLHLLTKKHLASGNIPKTGSIARYKVVLRDVFRLDVSKGFWHLLTDYEKIRDCFLHANGRVDLMRNEKEIRQVARRRGVGIKQKRLHIGGEFLSEFAVDVEAFIAGLAEQYDTGMRSQEQRS